MFRCILFLPHLLMQTVDTSTSLQQSEVPVHLNTQQVPVLTRATREQLSDITVLDQSGPDSLLTRLTDCYLGGLQCVTDNTELDGIHRKVILEHPVLRNNLFHKLLAGSMTPKDYALFFSEYNNASQADFYSGALPAALKAHDHAVWQEYIRHIIAEESAPKHHHVMFEEFMGTCGVSRQHPREPAQEYAADMLAGYTADLPFAAGYALGVEVEAGYEIAVLAKAMEHHFQKQLKETEWFNVHLADEQEVEHARVSVALVENVLESGGSIIRVRAGFTKFCDDVHKFMEGVYTNLPQ